MKRFFTICFWICLFATFATSATAIQLQELKPISFTSNGAKIAGWHWLRRAGNYAEWTFELPHNITKNTVAALCFSTLSTNTFNGGAGFNSTLKVILNQGPRFNVKLKNDCPCLKHRNGGNSHGIGYQSHGCAKHKIPKKVRGPNANILKVRVEYPRGNHTAVRQESLKMILMIKNKVHR